MVRYLLSLLATATLVLPSHAQTQFEWVSPLPHRQDWLSAAYGNGVFVGVTDGYGGRYLYASLDGDTWTRPAASISGTLRKVIFADGKFIVAGDNGQVLSSADGTTWTAGQAGNGTLMDVAFGNGVTVVVENGPRIYSSSDLTNWTVGNGVGTGFALNSVEFGNGIFLAIAEGSRLWKSADGVNWTELPWPDGNRFYDIAFSAGRFLLLNNGDTPLVSADGANWSHADTVGGMEFVAPVSDGFIGLRRGSVARSAEGVTWQTISELAWTGVPKAFAAGPSKWMILGEAGFKLSSGDGVAWTNETKAIDYSRKEVAFANGKFVRYGDVGGLLVSNDGAAWEEVANTPAFGGLAGGNGIWAGVSADGSQALVSSDAREWSVASGVSGTLHRRIVFGGGIFAVGTSEGVATSADGQNWTMRSIAGGGAVTMIGYLNGRFAAMAGDRRAVTSDDGVNWVAHEGKFVSGAHFAAGNDRFVGIWGAGMGPGNVAWSLDGISWFSQRLSSGSTHSNDSLSFGGGVFLQTDYYGNIYESRDGITWVGQRQAPQNFGASAYGNGAWVVVGGDSILRSSADRVAATNLTASVELRFDGTGQMVLGLNGPANGLLKVRKAGAIDGQWSDVATVRLSGAGSAIVPVTLGDTSGFFSATAMAE